MRTDIDDNIYSLILKAIDGEISESDFTYLEEKLKSSSKYKELYCELNIMYSYLRRAAVDFESDDLDNRQLFSNDFCRALINLEKTAPKTEPEIIYEESQSWSKMLRVNILRSQRLAGSGPFCLYKV